MNWWKKDCSQVIRLGGYQLLGITNCFQLWLYMVEDMIQLILKDNPAIGWGKGLRVGLYAFWCSNHQTVPQMQIFTPLTASLIEFNDAIKLARTVKPDGGTCPGQALEYAHSTIEKTNPRPYPYSALITLTDGLFYDMPRPAKVYDSLRNNLCVNTYAVGVSYNNPGTGDHPGTQGFTQAERDIQAGQMKLASGLTYDGQSRAYIITTSVVLPNPWQRVYNLTAVLAAEIVRELKHYATSGANYSSSCTSLHPWCGYGDSTLCNDPWRQRFCKWRGNQPGRWCTRVSDCFVYVGKGKSSGDCGNDQFCKWQGAECVPDPPFIPPPIKDETALCSAHAISQTSCNSVMDLGPAPTKARWPACYWVDIKGQPKQCISYGSHSVGTIVG
jgi:hypothetical protein